MQWALPKIEGLVAAFHASDDTLTPVEGQGDVSGALPAATLTQNLWKAALELPDIATLIVNSDKAMSIGLASGGLIVQARKKLNVGLLRAATKTLPPVEGIGSKPATNVPTATTFRKNIWQILTRLNEVHVPRVYRFDFGGQTGDVLCRDGTHQFGGGFATPTSFVAALQTAIDADKPVAYTLADMHGDFEPETYTAADILCTAVSVTADTETEFDPDGWPLVCNPTLDFATLQRLSNIAVAACAISDDVGAIELKGLSQTNQARLTGRSTPDRSIILTLPNVN